MCFLWQWRQKQPLSRDCILAGLGVCSVFFPLVISWEGTASLKCHVGQGSSPLGGFEQKLRVAISCFPQQGKGVGSTPQFWPELRFEKVTHEECEKSCIPTPVRTGIFPPHPAVVLYGSGLRRGCHKNLCCPL